MAIRLIGERENEGKWWVEEGAWISCLKTQGDDHDDIIKNLGQWDFIYIYFICILYILSLYIYYMYFIYITYTLHVYK